MFGKVGRAAAAAVGGSLLLIQVRLSLLFLFILTRKIIHEMTFRVTNTVKNLIFPDHQNDNQCLSGQLQKCHFPISSDFGPK